MVQTEIWLEQKEGMICVFIRVPAKKKSKVKACDQPVFSPFPDEKKLKRGYVPPFTAAHVAPNKQPLNIFGAISRGGFNYGKFRCLHDLPPTRGNFETDSTQTKIWDGA